MSPFPGEETHLRLGPFWEQPAARLGAPAYHLPDCWETRCTGCASWEALLDETESACWFDMWDRVHTAVTRCFAASGTQSSHRIEQIVTEVMSALTPTQIRVLYGLEPRKQKETRP